MTDSKKTWKRLTLAVPFDLYHKFRIAAAKANKSMSEWAREILESNLKDSKCIKSEPISLSVTQKPIVKPKKIY